MSVHFFTGFPGFISAELIKELIRKKRVTKVYAVVQETHMNLATIRATEIQKELATAIPFVIICGDITLPNLGMDELSLATLAKEELVFWHLAAIYDLAVKAEIAWKVNVKGTENVCHYLKGHPSIERFIYFSTSYVAGTREGNLLETELIRPPSFKNHYEETKFEAELIVEQLKMNVSTTIIRPGIVRGHSVTGETIKFDGPYFFMNFIDRLKWMPIIPYVGKSDAHINVVPIDYIIDASVYLANHKEASGQTVHLTDPSPHLVEDVYRAMVFELTGKSPKGRLPRPLAEKGLSFKKLQQKLGVEVETLDYLSWNASFDTAIAQRLLAGSGIKCADFITSMPAMVQFYNEHKKNMDFHIAIE